MRFPWSPAPGMVRVNDKELIGLFRGALRAAELEVETAAVERDTALVDADVRARRLLEERRLAGHGDVDPELRAYALAALPLRRDGQLHEAAFLALVEQRVRLEQELMTLLADGRGDAR